MGELKFRIKVQTKSADYKYVHLVNTSVIVTVALLKDAISKRFREEGVLLAHQHVHQLRTYDDFILEDSTNIQYCIQNNDIIIVCTKIVSVLL